MGQTAIANPIKEKLQKLYSDNYKCGFFKNTSIRNIADKPFV
jgi:hypothetical protein